MKNLAYLFIVLFFSCDTKESGSTANQGDELEFTYLVLIKENNKYISYMTEDINDKVSMSKGNTEIIAYDSLTKGYLKFIDDIESDINKNTSAILFDGDKYSATGKELIAKTKAYKAAIEELVTSENLKKRINLTLNTNDVRPLENEAADNNETGRTELNTAYAFYLDYYFKGLSNKQVLAHLSAKKKTILEMENEYIESMIKL